MRGSDLFGVAEPLPYVKSPGVTALYLNPIFRLASEHALIRSRRVAGLHGIRVASSRIPSSSCQRSYKASVSFSSVASRALRR
ncbi:MAG: alpha-amylase family glycosyl hydrolase [bacterium]